MWRPGRNIRDVRTSMTRKQRADIRCRRANILDASAHLLNELLTGSVGPTATAAGDTRQAVWFDFPWSAPRPCPSARKSARPAVSATRTVPHAGTSSADAGADRPESRYGTGRDQPWHDRRPSTTAAAPSQPCCNRGGWSRPLLSNPPVQSRGTPRIRNRIDFGKQDLGPKRGVNAGLVQKKQVRPGTRPGLTWDFRWS